ncbi:dihydrolipoyl dehydrogenase [Phycisphaerales bacterium AB-hyl4]|uniref:Dihydrolipoyl dehydrogenase n=1 Tax=Natronomicrosphaera hydrolytica TaxID=3242702 RepID=A0ABV4U6U5_9BACT
MSEHDLIVIGAGPGGYVAAIRAAQLGLNVACVDDNAEPGGTCLRVGCIPSKAMLESSERYDEAQHHLADHGVTVGSVKLDLPTMLKRKDKVVQSLTRGVKSLFKKNKVTHYQGRARLNKDRAVIVTDDKGNEQTHAAKHIIIATGSTPATLPGIDLSDKRVDTSTDALSYDKVPKKLAVIGAGYIGLELGAVWRRLGSEVTMIEYLDRILPGMDSEMATLAHKLFKKQGLNFRLGAKVTGAKSKGKGAVVELEGGETIEADRVLVAVGRKPNTEGLGLDEAGVELDERGRIKIDSDFKTSVANVYAVGDVVAGAMLAHKAEDEGVACVEKIVLGRGHVDYNAIPAVVYTHPEIASVGRTEEQLKQQGVAYRKGTFPFMANGRARSLEQTDGMVKILADEKTDRVLGVHILGPRAGDLIAECATAMTFGASSEDLVMACHAHPTLAEAVREAAMAVDDRAIHI